MHASLIETFERTMGPPTVPIMDRAGFDVVAAPGDEKGKVALAAARFEAAVAEWERQEAIFREQVTTISITDMSELDAFITHLDAKAEEFAKAGARAEKDYARMAKVLGRREPARGAAFRAGCLRVVKAEERVVRAVLDLSMFMRAIRADLRPDARGGPTFDNAADLKAYIAARSSRRA